jgi:hypothetical protein
VRAASAPFHYAHAARFKRQRAAAQLQRYAKLGRGGAISLRGAVVHLFAAVLVSFACAFTPGLSSQTARVQSTSYVVIYRDHFEVGGTRFATAEELRAYLESLSTTVLSLRIAECDIQERVREAVNVITSVAGKKAAEKGGISPFVGLDMARVQCPGD